MRLLVLALCLAAAAPAAAAGNPALAKLLAGPLTPDTLKDVIHEHRPELRACADARPKVVRDSPAKIVVRFVILPSGKLSGVTKASSTATSEPALEKCVLAAVSGWTFPKPKKGPVEVSFPFRFGAPPKRKAQEPAADPADEADPELVD